MEDSEGAPEPPQPSSEGEEDPPQSNGRSDPPICFLTVWSMFAIVAGINGFFGTINIIKSHDGLQRANWMQLQCNVLQKGIRADGLCGIYTQWFGDDGVTVGDCPSSSPSPAIHARLLQNSSSSSPVFSWRRLHDSPNCYQPWFLVKVKDGQAHRTACLYRWGKSAQSGQDQLIFGSTWDEAREIYDGSSEGEDISCYQSVSASLLSMKHRGFPGGDYEIYLGFLIAPIFLLCGLAILIEFCRTGAYSYENLMRACQSRVPGASAYLYTEVPQDP